MCKQSSNASKDGKEKEASCHDDDGGIPLTPPLLKICQPLVKSNGVIIGSEIADKTRTDYPTLLSSIPLNATTPFITSLDGRFPVSHSETLAFIRSFGDTLHALGVGRGQRVALVLPNGPELAMAILAVSNWTGCVPLSATGALSELEADITRCGPDLIIGPYSAGPLPATKVAYNNSNPNSTVPIRIRELARDSHVLQGDSGRDWTVHEQIQTLAHKLKINFVGLVPDPERAGPFKLWCPIGRKTKVVIDYAAMPNVPENCPELEHAIDALANGEKNEALVLFTSGTTGNKKLVPHLMGDILTASVVIALSWKLEPKDVNCNMMPLFHVGGIVRQVFSPLVSSSAVICCPSFDASLFWAMLTAEKPAFNWYYAAPTMHQIILQTGEEFLAGGNKYTLKMIANAAGGLLPSLAERLRETFHANVLPSYGMTECMPISSPPADYDLSKPGTSGVPVGPEVAILNTHTCEKLPAGQEGPVCVRGAPCFRGYGALANDPTASLPETFLKYGWFNTGDLGYLDDEGYLYITGRSKEVINRGGEIIPPMEVEEAVMGHPDIVACAAFSAAHDVLQETVGLCVVLKDDKVRRLDLPSLHTFVADKLAAPKWPQCLVYMKGGLPKSHTNKLLRVKLGSRLGLPELTDSMSTTQRTFEANCPPQGTPLEDSIPSKPVSISAAEVQATLRAARKHDGIWVCNHPSKEGAVVAYVAPGIDRRQLIDIAMESLSRYAVPTHIGVLESNASPPDIETLKTRPTQAKDAVASILNSNANAAAGKNETHDPIVEKVMELFVEVLQLDYQLAPDAHFFHIGGSSMLASQLARKVRQAFDVPCTGSEIFHHATPKDLAEAVKHRQSGEKSGGAGRSGSDPKVMDADRSHHNAPFGQQYMEPATGFGGDVVQLLPLFVLFPVWQILRYLLFFTLLVDNYRYFWGPMIESHFFSFMVAYGVFYLLWTTFVPLIFVFIKWMVIGRYEAGRYRIRGSYYLRWWLVDVCRKLIPKGIWASNDMALAMYYRMLGAQIGAGARISLECDLAEFDLVTVGKGAAVENCTLRGFGVDNGAMILGPVKVGDGSSVGMRSVVPPYTEVPDGKHLGPVTSAYDVTLGQSMNDNHARVNRMKFPKASIWLQMFVGLPITFFVQVVSQLPPLLVLYLLLRYKARDGEIIYFGNWNDLIYWLCSYDRIPFFIGIRLARALLSPFFYMAAAIFVKKTIIGTFKPGPRNVYSDWENFRYELAASLFTRKRLQKCTELIGRHYECVSVLYRLLGSKVGKRVFWPGSQPITDGTFDLLEIGDDVVFGSRSSVLCTTVDHSERVVLCAGANVSDNTVVMAGSVVGKNAVLGSNTLCPEGTYLPAASIWFGANGCTPTCLNAGDGSDFEFYQPLNEGGKRPGEAPSHASATLDPRVMCMSGDDSTLRPFGKAFYLGQVKGYRILSLPAIIIFTWLNRTFQVIFHLSPQLVAVQFGAVMLYTDNVLKEVWRNSVFLRKGDIYQDEDGVIHDKFLWWVRDYDNDGHDHRFGQVYFAILTCFIVVHFFRVWLWLAIELTAKYAFMGRRKPGRYNYDSNSYAQRWELYQLVAKIRKLSRLNLLQFVAGTPFMNMYFRWNGGKVGKNCCLYPAGADPFMPEPDLVSIGDGTVIDCASIVCHLNTKGNFELQKIVIEDKCTLRTRSRLQQGVVMESGSMLLEKSIALTGEVLETRSVWQGAPASQWFKYKDQDVLDSYQPPSAMNMALSGSTKGRNQKEVEMKTLR